MSMAPAIPEGPHWKVVSQVPTTGQDAAGNYVAGHQITATLDDGTAFQVFVPNSAYNADNVRAVLAEKAQRVADVGNLTA